MTKDTISNPELITDAEMLRQEMERAKAAGAKPRTEYPPRIRKSDPPPMKHQGGGQQHARVNQRFRRSQHPPYHQQDRFSGAYQQYFTRPSEIVYDWRKNVVTMQIPLVSESASIDERLLDIAGPGFPSLNPESQKGYSNVTNQSINTQGVPLANIPTGQPTHSGINQQVPLTNLSMPLTHTPITVQTGVQPTVIPQMAGSMNTVKPQVVSFNTSYLTQQPVGIPGYPMPPPQIPTINLTTGEYAIPVSNRFDPLSNLATA